LNHEADQKVLLLGQWSNQNDRQLAATAIMFRLLCGGKIALRIPTSNARNSLEKMERV
jgi:IS5 family transposase